MTRNFRRLRDILRDINLETGRHLVGLCPRCGAPLEEEAPVTTRCEAGIQYHVTRRCISEKQKGGSLAAACGYFETMETMAARGHEHRD